MLNRVRASLKRLAADSPFFYRLYRRLRNAHALVRSVVPDEPYARRIYKKFSGKELNLDNPATFDEKTWWLKLRNRDPRLTLCSDKLAVRDYVAGKGYADILVPLRGVYARAKDIDFSAFCEEIILKCNAVSGENFFFAPGGPWDNKRAQRQMQKTLALALKSKYHRISREWNYKHIPPRILAEKLLRDKEGRLPTDYRFFCFDGEPRVLTLDFETLRPDGTHNSDLTRNVYDMDFNLLSGYRITRANDDRYAIKPENFARMVKIARALAAPFVFCRVDLYNLDGSIYFGEITFYHAGGCNDIQPAEWDLALGSWIPIRSEKVVLR